MIGSPSACTIVSKKFAGSVFYAGLSAAQAAAGAACLGWKLSPAAAAATGAAAGCAGTVSYRVFRLFCSDESSIGKSVSLICAHALAVAPVYGTFRALDIPFNGKTFGEFILVEVIGGSMACGVALSVVALAYIIEGFAQACRKNEIEPQQWAQRTIPVWVTHSSPIPPLANVAPIPPLSIFAQD